MKKLFRISTVPISLNILLKGQLRYLNEFYEVTAISGSGKDLEEVQKREGVKTHIIEMQREISPLKDLVALYHLYHFFKKEKPDIVHSITPKAGLLSMVAAKLAGVPVRMHTFTGLIFPHKVGVLKYLLIWMDRILASNATHIFPEGQGVKKDLEHYQITRKPLRIISKGNVNGIDTAYFNPNQISLEQQKVLRQELGLTANDFVFVFLGRLVKDKGINELITTFKSLTLKLNQNTLHPSSIIQQPTTNFHPHAFPQLKLLLVGPFEKNLDPLFPETLKEIESNPDIISVGFQPDVRPYLAISNALAFPSYREGFPNVVLQSLAMELPAIVTNINGSNEIIIQRKNGLIIPVRDKHALQQAMMELSTSSALYQSLKMATRGSVFPYEQQKVWDALLEEYGLVAGVK